MTRDEMRDAIAHALADASLAMQDAERVPKPTHLTFDDLGKREKRWMMAFAAAALSSIESTGHVIVPREPTKEMVEAGCHKYSPGMSGSLLRSARRLIVLVYRAMLTAYGQEGKS